MLRTFHGALASGKRFSAAAVESRSGGTAYGERVLEEVWALGVAGVLVHDDAIYEGVSEADMVLVGADKLIRGGSIVNGWPTLSLAHRARGAVPLYVVCESFKLDDDPSVEEGFDLVRSDLITRVSTDTQP